jgi:hypothetical protein
MSNSTSGNQPLFAERTIHQAIAVSLTAAALAVAAAIIGIVAGTHIYGEAESLSALRPNDVVTLVFAVPFLMTSIRLCRIRRTFGMYAWIAALFYLVYNYVPYLIDVPTRGMLGLYVPLVAALLLSIALLIRSVRLARVPLISGGRVGVGIFLLGLSALLLAYQSVEVLRWITGGKSQLSASVGVLLTDLALAVPVLVIAGIQSITGRGLGPMGAASVLLSFALLCVGLLVLFVVQTLLKLAEFSLIDFGVVLIMALACLTVFAAVVRRRP